MAMRCVMSWAGWWLVLQGVLKTASSSPFAINICQSKVSQLRNASTGTLFFNGSDIRYEECSCYICDDEKESESSFRFSVGTVQLLDISQSLKYKYTLGSETIESQWPNATNEGEITLSLNKNCVLFALALEGYSADVAISAYFGNKPRLSVSVNCTVKGMFRVSDNSGQKQLTKETDGLAIGLGVGIPLLVIGIAVIIIYFVYKRSNSQDNSSSGSKETDTLSSRSLQDKKSAPQLHRNPHHRNTNKGLVKAPLTETQPDSYYPRPEKEVATTCSSIAGSFVNTAFSDDESNFYHEFSENENQKYVVDDNSNVSRAGNYYEEIDTDASLKESDISAQQVSQNLQGLDVSFSKNGSLSPRVEGSGNIMPERGPRAVTEL